MGKKDGGGRGAGFVFCQKVALPVPKSKKQMILKADGSLF